MRALQLLFRDWTAQNLVALGGLGVALAVCATVAARIVSPPPMPAATPAAVRPFPHFARGGGTDDAGTIAATLEADPFGSVVLEAGFAPDAGPEESTSVAPAPLPPALPSIRLQGVALLPGGPRAIIAVGDRPARLLRQGQTVVDRLRIARVAVEGVTVSSPETTFVLRLAGKGEKPSAAATSSAVATRPGQP